MFFLRLVLIAGWLLVTAFMLLVMGRQEVAEAYVFVSDIVGLTWRGLFNVDFIVHLLLLAIWVMWRHRFSVAGILCGLLCLGGGALFSFPYLLVASLQAKGDLKRLMLGRQGEAA